MSKYESAIIRYESARINRRDIKREHNHLISQCERIQYEKGAMHPLHATTCGQKAWAVMIPHNEGLPYDEQDTYDDVFFNTINHFEGACAHCKSAHTLKFTRLSSASKELGIAKRVITQLAKGLMNG